MKEFFKYVLATVVGILLTSVIMFVFSMVVIIGLIATMGSEKTTAIKENTILYLNLDQPILERTPEKTLNNVPLLGSGDPKSIGFNDLIKALKEAKTDSKIKGIYINVSAPQAGMATMLEVRNALLDFKESKKPVIAYSEVYSQGAYYLASAADKIYLNPEGGLQWKGFVSELTFLKGALEKLGVEAQIIRVGDYKSAVEPFTSTKMSDYNRKQVTDYLEGMYGTFLSGISKSRHISTDSLRWLANEYKIQQPKDALQYRLIDGLKYKDEILDELRLLSKKGKKSNIPTISINDYMSNLSSDSYSVKDKIAVVYANGNIMSGEGSDETIGSERISRVIRKARMDENVKALVLRVNSGGGSALASEVIWREVELTKKVKPVIASFGDVAASGGYYIAAAADSIFVQPSTITGSIGVFGIIPNFEKLFTQHLGITFDGVKTGKYADIMSFNRPMTADERFIIQNDVNRIYDTFLSRVAAGRKKTKAQVDSVSGGHVWVGTDAVRIGLADRVGGFNEAIASAAKKAKVSDYRIVEYPEKIDPLKALISNAKDQIRIHFIKQELGEHYPFYQDIRNVTQMSGVQARMDYQIKIK